MNTNNNIININISNFDNKNMVFEERPIFDLYCEEESLDEGDLLDSEIGFLGSHQNVDKTVFSLKNGLDSAENGKDFVFSSKDGSDSENGFLGMVKNEKDCVFSSKDGSDSENEFLGVVKNEENCVFLTKDEVDWGDDELSSLFSKEKCVLFGQKELVDREGAVEWMLRVVSHYGFRVLTTALAVNYFDRFSASATFQRDKQWMSQLAAVACLSIAAKVEETRVPLLIDLQVQGAKYVFEAKTIMRMELLVLSTLGWKMNPVTPLSFVDYVIRRLGMKNHLRLRFLGRCERVLISAITDSKYGSFLPSVLAAGTMLYVLKEVEPDNVLDCQTELLHVLEMNMDEVDECYEFILDIQAYETNKRKYMWAPNSPNGVIDAYFSSDSSNDSWIVAPVDTTSSPELPFKRSRCNDQQLRASLSRR